MKKMPVVLAGGLATVAGLAIFMVVQVPRSGSGEGTSSGRGTEEEKVVPRAAQRPGRAARREDRRELHRVMRQPGMSEEVASPGQGAPGATGLPGTAPGGIIQPGALPGGESGETGAASGTGGKAVRYEPGIRGWLKARNQAPSTPEARQARLTMLRARLAHIPREIKAAKEQLARRHEVGEMPMDEEENVRQGIKNMEAALERTRKDLAKLESEGSTEKGTPASTP